MKKYVIAIEEIVVKEFDVVAANANDALEFAKNKYSSGEFCLDPGEVQFKQMVVFNSEKERIGCLDF